MNAKSVQLLILTLIAGSFAFYQRFQGKSWWFWGLLSSLLLPTLVESIGEYSKSKGGTGHPRFNRFIVLSASLFMAGVAIVDGFHGNGWVFSLFLSLVLAFFAWTAGLPDSEPSRQEPSFDPTTPPQIPFEEAIFTGSDADFSYCMNEFFPLTDWKDNAEEVLELFLPHVPALNFKIFRGSEQTDIALTLGGKTETLHLETGPEAAQIIEPIAHFLAPEYIICSYVFTEGSDAWVNPIFSAACWDRLKRERPDRAALLTPYIEHHTLSKGPKRSSQ